MNEERRELECSLLLIEIERKGLETEDAWNEWLESEAQRWEQEVERSSVTALTATQSLI